MHGGEGEGVCVYVCVCVLGGDALFRCFDGMTLSVNKAFIRQ